MPHRVRGFLASWRLLAVAGSTTGATVLVLSGLGGTSAPVSVYHPLLSIHAQGTAEHLSQSNNWSGYNKGFLENFTTFHSISAQWTVPTATQHTKGEAENSATWIGIGGGCLDTACTLSDNTLVQAGTEQDVAADGTASYSAWWEIVPVPSLSASIAVHPGDLISCSIAESVPEVWNITLNDVTDGQGFTQTVPYPSTYLTAEWILETPVVLNTSGASGIAALPNLTPTHFSQATVNGQSAGLNPAEGLQLVDSSGAALATPSAPNPAANGFNDCTHATSCPAPTS
ncbi:MAG TPA: G1 family glutamic endopeptidase [Acidimicrobiales bacterium]|nr:G1 family glutamic endopeptidase [Acidimicrobiales bacterium]